MAENGGIMVSTDYRQNRLRHADSMPGCADRNDMQPSRISVFTTEVVPWPFSRRQRQDARSSHPHIGTAGSGPKAGCDASRRLHLIRHSPIPAGSWPGSRLLNGLCNGKSRPAPAKDGRRGRLTVPEPWPTSPTNCLGSEGCSNVENRHKDHPKSFGPLGRDEGYRQVAGGNPHHPKELAALHGRFDRPELALAGE